MIRRAFVLGLVLGSSLVVSSCLRDFDRFEATDGGPDDGSAGGSNGGSTSSAGSPGSGGAPGSGGNVDDGCSVGEKNCLGECVPDDDPATGCATESCSACPTENNATIGCDAGECAVLGCEAGFVDCDDSQEGCEHSPSSFDETKCGGCNADCTSLGLSNCQSGRCGCAQASDCSTEGNIDSDCVSRLCQCGGTTCNVGETCIKQMGSAQCSCGGGGPCEDGWVCCPGSDGPSCKQLDGTDSSNCGACGWTCAQGEVCVDGVCQ